MEKQDMTPFDVIAAPEPATASPPFAHSNAGSLPDEACTAYRRDGVVCIKNVIDDDQIEQLRLAIDEATETPSDLGYRVNEPGKPGFFFTDYNLWQRFDAVRDIAFNSLIADIAGSLMQSDTVTLYFDNVFVKEKGSKSAIVPWHEDAMYMRMYGLDVINFWIALDPVPTDVAVQFKRGSHKRQCPPYRAIHFNRAKQYPDPITEGKIDMPPFEELDNEFETVCWAAEPGDACIFTQRTLHASPGGFLKRRRRAIGFLLLGDDARFNGAPGISDPPFMGNGLKDGDRPQCAMFPQIRPRPQDVG